jgi:hypothetical protein
MGRWSGAAKRATNSIFITLEPGVQTRLRILDDPYAQNKTFMKPTGEPGDPRTVFSWPVWDYDLGKIRILSQGASVLKQIDAILDAWGIDDMPMKCDIVITRTGQGLQTRYDVQGVPTNPQLNGVPSDYLKDMPDMDKHIENGVPVQQYADGYKLKSVVTGSNNSDDDDDPTLTPPPDFAEMHPLEPPEDLDQAV